MFDGSEQVDVSDKHMSRVRPLKDSEREQIIATLEYFSGNKRSAARALGISLNTLYNRLRDYGIPLKSRQTTQLIEREVGSALGSALNEADLAKLGIMSLDEVQRQYVQAVLEYLRWDKVTAAFALGISLLDLRTSITKWGLVEPPQIVGFFSAPDFTLGKATVSASSDRVSHKQFVCRGCGHWFHDPCPVLPQTHCKACKKKMGDVRSRIFPLQKKAHEKVKNAMARGQLLPPSQLTCRDCGETAECYDHRDYRKPLEVDAVCTRCNVRRGAALPYAIALPEGGGYRLIEHKEQAS